MQIICLSIFPRTWYLILYINHYTCKSTTLWLKYFWNVYITLLFNGHLLFLYFYCNFAGKSVLFYYIQIQVTIRTVLSPHLIKQKTGFYQSKANLQYNLYNWLDHCCVILLLHQSFKMLKKQRLLTLHQAQDQKIQKIKIIKNN